MTLSSFDVFDTLLVRSWAVPSDLFLEVGQDLTREGLIDVDQTVFKKLRMQAEQDGRRLSPCAEVDLDQIYRELGRQVGWSASACGRAMEIELAAEERALHAVPEMVSRVCEERKISDAIVFISDMYLPSGFLERVLRREGFFLDGDRLFLSNEHQASKATGELFEKVRNEFPKVRLWKHRGDNLHADVQVPSRLGIQAEAFTNCHLNRYEVEMRGDGRSWRSRAAAAMRLARLKNPEKDEHRKAVWDSGSNVVGPMWFGFVHWCLEEAVRRGIKRLYFVSRDGQIFLKIARELVKNWGYDVDCRYLYGSRQAWHSAALSGITRDDLEWLVPSTRFLSVGQVFAFLNIRPVDFADRLESIGLPTGRWTGNLSPAERAALGTFLLEPSVSQMIASAAVIHRQTVMAYLTQEGFFEEIPFGIVDIGWFGNLQKSLARILHASGRIKESALHGFYFGLRGKRRFSEGQTLLGYWNKLSGRPNFLKRHNLALFELFAAADHGSVIGYQQMGHRWEPKLSDSRNRVALDWGLEALQGGVVAFAAQMVGLMRREELEGDEFLKISRQFYRLFYRHPDALEAETWGRFRYSEEQIEKNFVEFLPAMSWSEMTKASLSRKFRPGHWWVEGSLVRQRCLPARIFLIGEHMKAFLKP